MPQASQERSSRKADWETRERGQTAEAGARAWPSYRETAATPRRRIALALALVTSLAGCATHGRFTARLPQDGGGRARPATAEWQSDWSGDNGTLSLTLPDGEHFSGKFTRIGLLTTPDRLAAGWGGWKPWQPYWNQWGRFGTPWVEGEGFATFLQNYYGRIIATLYGDRGSAMRCRFALPEPDAKLADGASGECQVEDGRTLDLQTAGDAP